ncbi:hypothetical protein CkaCkLH20_08162 [Colletotrichum karsti]|uniref:Zn(2)-C6 fungal-type domain-containing protein n=1 Tax=Colletotrichum karsti TaxID=1095194 RepID=A0A9P6I167_9PEZI|nr:uncharacterized protein CkaCkLH20_08162 [Colletotrichum karsti]KAF9874179.1 hypothetical protein CkaCkLH20_08162 [Colletotrichum karsti]
MKPLSSNLRMQRTKTGCVSCREARKKCCERKPQCTRCSLKNLTCVYEEKRETKSDKRASRAPRRGRKPFPGKQPRPEEGFIHTFAIAKSTSSVSSESSIDCRDNHQIDMSQFLMDLDEPMDFSDYCGDGIGSESCSTFTNSIFEDSRSTRSSSAELMSLELELAFPTFSEMTTDPQSRKLLHHFCSTLCRLIVFEEQPKSSFRDLILPLAYDNSPVLYAICAFAGGHLEYMGVQTTTHSSQYRAMAAKGAFELVQWKSQQEEVLATVMFLAYYESLTMSNAPNMVIGHLKAAFLIISSAPESERSLTMRFLEKAFHYMDVISALSLGISPVSAMPVSDYTYPLAVMSPPKPNAPTYADPFIGVSGDLWPILYRLGLVTALKGDLDNAMATQQSTKAAVLRVEYESMTKATEKALRDWQPAVMPNSMMSSMEDETSAQQQLEAMVHSSQSYRHSALVYLHRVIYSHPTSHPEVQSNSHLSLESCAAVAASGGSLYALLWPLFVAACEAITDHDRSLAKLVLEEISRRQGMVNVERAESAIMQRWTETDMQNGDQYGHDEWTFGPDVVLA